MLIDKYVKSLPSFREARFLLQSFRVQIQVATRIFMNTNPYLRLLLIVLADGSTEVRQIFGHEDAQAPFTLLRGKGLHDEVSNLLEVLDDRERKIILQRFALDGGKSKTLEEVA